MSIQDVNGHSGNPTVIIGGSLVANTTYDASLSLLNASITTVENMNQPKMYQMENVTFDLTIQ